MCLNGYKKREDNMIHEKLIITLSETDFFPYAILSPLNLSRMRLKYGGYTMRMKRAYIRILCIILSWMSVIMWSIVFGITDSRLYLPLLS